MLHGLQVELWEVFSAYAADILAVYGGEGLALVCAAVLLDRLLAG